MVAAGNHRRSAKTPREYLLLAVNHLIRLQSSQTNGFSRFVDGSRRASALHFLALRRQ
jgi:hypothetical protein